MASKNPKMKLKLYVDTSNKKVLYAEASKDFVDFLIYLLTLPLGTVVKLLKDTPIHNMGSLPQFYESLKNLSDSYLQPNLDKSSILNPRARLYTNSKMPVLLTDSDLTDGKIYRCPNSSAHPCFADVPGLTCRACKLKMTCETNYVSPSGTVEGGYIRGLVLYMVMDNLEVLSMSSKHVVTLLDKFNVKNLGGLEEIVVEMGPEEGLKLLKLSLESKSVLTKFYIENLAAVKTEQH